MSQEQCGSAGPSAWGLTLSGRHLEILYEFIFELDFVSEV